MNPCVYCGNPKTERKRLSDEEGHWDADICSVCGNSFQIGSKVLRPEVWDTAIADHSEVPSDLVKDYGEDVIAYIKKFRIDELSPEWEVFFWDESGADVSEDNLSRCQRIYDKKPDDPDNLIRILLLRICAGKDYKDLSSQFMILWKKRIIKLYFIQTSVLEDKFCESNLSKLRGLFIWLLNANPEQFREEVDDLWQFVALNKIVGIEEMSKLIVPETILLDDWDLYWDEEYLKYYAIAKYFYSEEDWFKAYCIFEKLRIYNSGNHVTNEELAEFEISVPFFKDIVNSLPTIEEIDSCADECFLRINLSDINEKARLQTLLTSLYMHSCIYQTKLNIKKNELNSYLSIYTIFTNIFSALSKGEYEQAFNKWVGWDKSKVRMLGIDVWETTLCLKRLKDGIGKEELNLAKLFSNNYFVEHFSVIADIEIKLREFIVENLKSHYGGDDEAWIKGVPKKIRIACRTKQEEKGDKKTSHWAFLDFTDYLEIIRTQESWASIFKNYFVLEKKDAQKSKDELTSFLQRLIHLRNTIVHVHRPLDNAEKEEIRATALLIDKIYKRWKK